jgi:hypothetical protein
MDDLGATENKGPSLVWVAITISVVLHGLFMLFMRPQTMTKIIGAGASERQRRPIELREAASQSDSIRITAVDDVESSVDSPPLPVEDTPQTSTVTESFLADGRDVQLGVKEEIEKISVQLPEISHVETISRPVADAADAVQAQVSPIAPKTEPGFGRHPDPVLARPDIETTPPVSPLADAPAVDSPTSIGRLPEVNPSHWTSLGRIDGDYVSSKVAPKVFIPIEKVMPEIDKKIVEEEKAAVRDLLNVKDAEELKPFVNVAGSSAGRDDWVYFKIRMTPRTDLKIVPKDVVILFDASLSVHNDRLASCCAHAKTILRSCMNTYDRFNLVAFRDDFEYVSKTWMDCTPENYAKADRWMSSQVARGRTDVFASAASVLKLPRDPKRPLIALIVTDGVATKGVSQTPEILSKFTRLNDGLISVYMYGVKEKSNRELINILTRGNRGESFIYEGSMRSHAGRQLESFSTRFIDPVLTDMRVVFTSESKAQAYPTLLKNLYRDQAVDIVGRVPKGTPEVAFSLMGLNGAKAYEGFFKFRLADLPFDKTVPALWDEENLIDRKIR